MASKNVTDKTKSENPNGNSGGDNWVRPQFVKYRLSEDELSQARAACGEMSDAGEIIDQMVGEGYKVSFSRDGYGGGIQVYMNVYGGKEGENVGWTLSARAPDFKLAVGVLAWKHYTLFSQIWPKDEAERRGSNWG